MEFIVVAVVSVFVLLFSTIRTRRIDEAWRRAAALLGLRHRPGNAFKGPKLMGRYQEFWIDIELKTRSSGKHARFITSIRAIYPQRLRMGLVMTRTGLFTGIKKLFGAQDIEVNDSAFDDMVVIKGRDPEVVRAFLTPRRRRHVQRLIDSLPGARITDTEISMEFDGAISEAKKMVEIVQAFVLAGSALMEPS